MPTHIKVGKEGRTFASENGDFWMSPARDMAYNFVPMAKMALLFIDDYPDNPAIKSALEVLGDDAEEAMQSFIKNLIKLIYTMENSPRLSIDEAIEEAEFYGSDSRAIALFGAAFFNIYLSAYMNGMKELVQCRHYPHMFGEPSEIDLTKQTPVDT